MRTTTAALIPAWALTLSLIPAAVVFGQPSPETPETPWCEVLMPEPADGPESVYQYSLVPVPEGSSTEIGILFLYTDLLARDDVERRTDYWIQRSNSMLSRGTSGLQLKSVGVLPAPASVSAADGEFASSAVLQALGLVNEAHEDPYIASARERLGGDLFVLVHYLGTGFGSGCGAGAGASLWTQVESPNTFRDRALAMVGLNTNPDCGNWDWAVFIHEIGHNLGLAHDRDSYARAGVLEAYSDLWSRAAFGYWYKPRDRNNPVGTIMSTEGTDLDGFSNGGRFLLPLASGSEPTLFRAGNSLADADAALRLTIGHVAAFYGEAGEYWEGYNDGYETAWDRAGPNTAAHNIHDTLHDSRFIVAASYLLDDVWTEGRVHPANVGSAGVLYYFFDEDNPELLVKILDGCAINGKYWLYVSAATDLDVRLLVDHGSPSKVFSIPGGSFGLVRTDDEYLACDP